MVISHMKFRAKEKMKKDKAIILGVSLVFLALSIFIWDIDVDLGLGLDLILMLVEAYLGVSLIAFFLNLAKTCNGDIKSLKVKPKAYFRFVGYTAIMGAIGFVVTMVLFLPILINMGYLSLDNSFLSIYEAQYLFERLFWKMIIIILIAVVVGILLELYFFCTGYLILEDNSLVDSIKGSFKLMKGYKWKLLLTQLSFIGWALLVPLTCGIYAVWFVPYYKATMAQFYIELRRERVASNKQEEVLEENAMEENSSIDEEEKLESVEEDMNANLKDSNDAVVEQLDDPIEDEIIDEEDGLNK